MRTMRWFLVGVVLALGSGCVEADLGDVPVYCNQWEPRCPAGYTCAARDSDGEEVCLRPGQALSVADGGLESDGR